MHRILTQVFGAVLAAGLSWSPASAQTTAPAPTTSPTMSTSSTGATVTTTRAKSEATQELINKIIDESLARTQRAKQTGTEERFDR